MGGVEERPGGRRAFTSQTFGVCLWRVAVDVVQKNFTSMLTHPQHRTPDLLRQCPIHAQCTSHRCPEGDSYLAGVGKVGASTTVCA